MAGQGALFRPAETMPVRQARRRARGRGGAVRNRVAKRKSPTETSSSSESSGRTTEDSSKYTCTQSDNGIQQLTLENYTVSFTNKREVDSKPVSTGFASARTVLGKRHDVKAEPAKPAEPDVPVIRLDAVQERISKLDFERPLLIVAGAGSGKTATLCARVIEMMKSGVHPKGILVITFTNKAADELKQRILRYMQASGMLENVDIKDRGVVNSLMPSASTFHSWCYGMIMRFYRQLGMNKCPLVAAAESEHKRLMVLAKEQLEDCRRLVQCEQMLGIPGCKQKDEGEPSIYIQHTEARWNEVLRLARETTGFSIDSVGLDQDQDQDQNQRGKKTKFAEKARTTSQQVSLMRALYEHLYAVKGRRMKLLDLVENPIEFGAAFPGKDLLQGMLSFMYRAKAKGYRPQEMPQLERSVLEAYNGTLRQFDLVDFDDILDMTNQLLSDKDVLLEIRGQFPYLLVDEFQDFNRLQTQLVLKLQENVGRVTAVGDLKQSIFEFRGATCEENYHIFLEKFVDAQVEGKALGSMESLTTNYRSHKSIVDLSNILALETVDEGDEQLRRLLTPSQAVPDAPEVPVTVWSTSNIQDEARTFGLRIKAILDRGDCKASDIAVISRCINFGAYRPTGLIETELLRRGIPFVVRGGKSALKSKRMQIFMALIRLIANPNDDLAAEYCLDELVMNVGPAAVRKIKNQGINRLEKQSLFDKMTTASTNTGLLSKNARAGLQAFLADIDLWQQKQIGHVPLSELIKDIFAKYLVNVEEEDNKGKPQHTNDEDEPEGDAVLDMSMAILDSLFEAPELLPSNDDSDVSHDGPCTMGLLQAYSSHLCLLSTAAEDQGKLKKPKMPNAKSPKYEGAIVITTVHQAKGLEWKHVFLNHFIEGMFPMGFRGISKADEARALMNSQIAKQNQQAAALHYREESRLGYVAITRAKTGLYISVLEKYPVFWMEKVFDKSCSPSRFLPNIMYSAESSSKRRCY
ncbi:hypothetical protein LPJ68_004500 [Coemansia sp. RSA 1086]|nr:hypothetical protein LPJ68_004500 [Coemansia sp. RSA 1086]